MPQTSRTAFCLSCAREFRPASPDVQLCPDCGGPPEAPAAGFRTLVEPDQTGGGPNHTLREPQPGRSYNETNAPAELQPGDTLLDTYSVSGLLGEGGMGKVYRVHHKSWNIDLAVKSPHATFVHTQAERDLFVSEAETWVKLGLHPHITACYYVRVLGGIPRVFAELIEGGSLADWISKGKIATQEKALDIAIQFAWGLAYAHSKELVHRDVKPANVLITSDGIAKVTDFGLVKAGKGMTPAYASPEQAEAQLKTVGLTAKSDIWSWGLSVLEMFAGRAFWVRPDMPDYAWGQVAPQALEHYLSAELEETNISAMPGSLADLLAECFQADPSARPASMDQVADRLVALYRKEIGKEYPRPKPKPAELRADSLNNKALSLLDLDRVSDAEEAWQQAMQADPSHIESAFNYSLWRWRRGDLSDSQAIEQFETISSSQPARWQGYWLTGLLQIERGDRESAEKTLQTAARIESGSEEILQARELLKALPASGLVHQLTSKKEYEAFCLSPDGNIAITGWSDINKGVLEVWDLNKGEVLHTLRGHSARIGTVLISPDGQTALSTVSTAEMNTDGVGMGADITDEYSVRVWNLPSGRSIYRYDHGARVSHMQLLQNGRLILIAREKWGVFLYETGKKNELHLYQGKGEDSIKLVTLSAMAAAPDGRWMVTAVAPYSSSFNQEPKPAPINVWEMRTNRLVARLQGHTGRVEIAEPLPGNRLLTRSNHELFIWDMTSFKPLTALKVEESISCHAINPISANLATGSYKGSINIWDHQSGTLINSMKLDRYEIKNIVFSSDGKLIFSASANNMIRIWDLSSGRCLRTFTGHSGTIIGLAAVKGGQRLVSCGNDGTLRVWDIGQPDSIRSVYAVSRPRTSLQLIQAADAASKEIEKARQAIAAGELRQGAEVVRNVLAQPGYERDARALELLHEAGMAGGRRKGLLSVRDLRKFDDLSDLPGQLILGLGGKTLLANYRSTANLMVYGNTPPDLWDLQTGSKILDLAAICGSNNPLAVGMRSSLLVVAARDGEIYACHLPDGKIANKFNIASRRIHALALDPAERLIACIAEDENYKKTLSIWIWEKGQKLHDIPIPDSYINDLLFTPDGHGLLTLPHKIGTIHSFDPETGKQLRKFRHTGTPVRFSLDWNTMLTGCKASGMANEIREMNTVKVWSLLSGSNKQFKHITSGIFELILPGDKFAYVRKGDYTRTADRGGRSIILADLQKGNSISELIGHNAHIIDIKITSDGQYLVSSSSDQTLRIWRLENGECLRTIETQGFEPSVIALSPDERYLAASAKGQIRVWELAWDYDFPAATDWPPGANLYVTSFVDRKRRRSPRGKINWTVSEVSDLYNEFRSAGFRWISSDLFKHHLEKKSLEG